MATAAIWTTPMRLPQVSCKYGAPMGRRDNISEPNHPVKFQMVRLRWVDYDYDQGGAYWGHRTGESMYWARGDGRDEVQEIFVRATSRDAAKAAIRETFKNARFYK